MRTLPLPGMAVVHPFRFTESGAELRSCRGFDFSGSRTSTSNFDITSPLIACVKFTCLTNRLKSLHRSTHCPSTRALWSREGKRRGIQAPNEFPSIRGSSKGPPPALKEDADELPSLFRTKRRQDSSPEDGGGGGGWGFPANDSNRDSGGSKASPKAPGPNKFVLAGLFVMGIGAGIALDTVVNVEPANVASREVIDRQTPNPDVCIANGMSAMVLDQRLFITFNPFNVYVSQAEVKPGCVLHQSNWRVLESRGLVNSEEVRDCKRNFNTFGFVGDLRQAPEITCVYHSENAENQFLKDPSKAALGDGFQPKTFNEP